MPYLQPVGTNAKRQKTLKVEKVKNRLLYDIGVIVILLGFGYVFFTNGKEIKFEDFLLSIFLFGAGFCAAARAFYFDRHMRIIQNKPIADFWLFLNNTKFEWLLFIYFFIRPVFGKREEIFLENNRIKINIYAACAYFFIIGFIMLLIFKQ